MGLHIAQQQERVTRVEAMRQKYPFTDKDIILCANIDRGRLFRYSSVSYCKHHDCMIDYNHIEVCDIFQVDNLKPSVWMKPLKDRHETMY